MVGHLKRASNLYYLGVHERHRGSPVHVVEAFWDEFMQAETASKHFLPDLKHIMILEPRPRDSPKFKRVDLFMEGLLVYEASYGVKRKFIPVLYQIGYTTKPRGHLSVACPPSIENHQRVLIMKTQATGVSFQYLLTSVEAFIAQT